MNMRKITSMTMLISLVVLILNSVVLYVVPEGRVAYWADWKFWGLTKGQWGDQHITVGVLFLIAGLLHIYYNWGPIKAYMKNKAKEFKMFTPSFNIALVLTAVFVVGTYYNIPPMSSILTFGENFKHAGAEKYGEPPYGHAELSSLKFFVKKEGLDLQKSMELLQKAGIKFNDEKDTLVSISKANSLTPKEVYEAIKPASVSADKAAGEMKGEKGVLPDTPKPGLGKETLMGLCESYDLEYKKIEHALAGMGLKVTPEMTMKDVGAQADKDPHEIYEVLYHIVNDSK